MIRSGYLHGDTGVTDIRALIHTSRCSTWADLYILISSHLHEPGFIFQDRIMPTSHVTLELEAPLSFRLQNHKTRVSQIKVDH